MNRLIKIAAVLVVALFLLVGCVPTTGADGAAATPEEATASNMMLIGTVLLMGVVLYFFMWRPQKKKEKQANELRNSIEIGDEVTTIGGIVGRVVSIKEDTFVIETAGERSRMRFKRWAIQEVGKLNLEAGSEPENTVKPESSERGGFFGFGKKKKKED